MEASRGTECETCLAVANGGRIRLTESRAGLLVSLLRKERHEQLVQRRIGIDGWDPAGASVASDVIRDIDVLLEEVERTRIERGWRTSHEPERSNPT